MRAIGLLAVVCLLLAGCAGQSGAAGGILYDVYKDPGGDTSRVVYYLSNPQAEPMELLNAPTNWVNMWFSADGQWIGFLYGVETASPDPSNPIPVFEFTLQTISPDGQKRVTWASCTAHVALGPTFFLLPDNRHVAYNVCNDYKCSQSDLYIGELSSGTKTLQASGDMLRIVGVSAQSRVLYSSFDPDARMTRYYLVEPGGEPSEVTDRLPEVLIRLFAFTAKNQALAVTMDLKLSKNTLQIADADLNNWRTLQAPGEQVRDFYLSPDGSLAVVGIQADDCEGAASYALEVVDLSADTASRLGCTFQSLPVEISPDLSEVIWADEKIVFHRSSVKGEGLEEFPAGTGYMRYSADSSQIFYWFRDMEAAKACLYMRPRSGGEAQKLEKTCFSTADLAAMPGYLLVYRAGK